MEKTPPAPVKWKVTTGLTAISELEREWRALAHERHAAWPYCGPEYLIAAMEVYHSEDRPVVISAYSRGRLAGVLPLVSRRMIKMGFSVREMGFPNNPNVINNDPLIAPRDETDAATVAGALLQGAFSLEADSLILDHLPSAPAISGCLRSAAACIGGWSLEPVPARRLFYAKLCPDWKDYLATRSRNHRWQVRKALKQAADTKGLEVRRICGRDQIRLHLRKWFDVERRSWQAADPGAAMSAADRQFHDLLLDRLAPEDVGDLWLVLVKDRPIAALRMLAGAMSVSVHTTHFDSSARDQAPGLLAFSAMMRAACEDGLQEVDMHGCTDFFKRWATGDRPHETLRIFAPTLRGRALWMAARAKRGVLHRETAKKRAKDPPGSQ
ncbi:GNAT family N-acetyltransferase [Roseovarius sp. S4756]|uniref:GNAT family N-acetyltransferase n=1 Tax=Roseovarius maritimus TaxID=3342637 RepID=UPI0037271DBC